MILLTIPIFYPMVMGAGLLRHAAGRQVDLVRHPGADGGGDRPGAPAGGHERLHHQPAGQGRAAGRDLQGRDALPGVGLPAHRAAAGLPASSRSGSSAAPDSRTGAGELHREEPDHGQDHRRHRHLAHPHHRLRLRHEQAERPGLGADLRGLRAGAALARREEARRAVRTSTTTTSRRSSSTTTRPSRWASASAGRSPTRAAAPRALPPVSGHPALAAAHRRVADGRRVRPVVLPGQGRSTTASSRRCRCCAPHEPAWPVARGAAAGRRAAVSDPHGARAATSWARRCAARSRAIPRTCAVASSRTGGLSHQVHGERAGFNNTAWDKQFLDLIEKRPGAARRHDARRVRDARRHGRRRGHHVAGDARRAVGQRASACTARYYLPSMTGIATAIYENDAGPRRATRSRATTASTSAHQLAGAEALDRAPIRSRWRRSVKALPHQHVPARADRARRTARRSWPIPRRRSRRPGSPTRSATWSAAATGAA